MSLRPHALRALLVSVFLPLSVSVPAKAGPSSRFPDLNNFTPVEVSDYITEAPRSGARLIAFTPMSRNYVCQFDASEPSHGSNSGLMCWGTLPGVPEDVPTQQVFDPSCPLTKVNPGSWNSAQQSERPGMFQRQGWHCGEPPLVNDEKILDAGQRVSYGTVTCAAIGDDAVACLDTNEGKHGFIVSPDGSQFF